MQTMQWLRVSVGASRESEACSGWQRWTRRLAACLFAVAVLGSAQQAPPGSPQSNSARPAADPTPGQAAKTPDKIGNPVADAGQQNADSANAERRKQLADDGARLVKLAADLKAEVDKTTKDTLSLDVIRKADEIEKLARSVKERMKQAAAN